MKKVYLFVCLLIIGIAAKAATITWKSATTGGDWSTATNWTGDVAPVDGDDVVFNNTGSITVTLASSVACRSISIQGTANVTLTASGAFTVTLGAATPALNINASRVLTLSGSVSGSQGVVLSIPTGGTATINGSLNLAGFGNTITTQVNQLIAVDAGSVIVASGGTITNNVNNGGLPFGTYGNNNVIVFQSGSGFTAYATGSPFGSASGPGTAQFLAGSNFNVFGGSGIGAASMAGRTYGRLALSNGGTAAAHTNTSTFKTAILDTLVVTANNVTLQGGATGTVLDTTFYIANIRLSTNSATATSSSIAMRANATTGSPDANFIISGRIDIIAGPATTSITPLNFTIGPNFVGSATSTATTNVIFTGANGAIKITKQGAAAGYPNLVMGAPNGGTMMPVHLIVANGASLALGDSVSLRTGNSYTKLTIRPTGRLTLIDEARFTTNHNNNFNIESSAAGTGSIGEGNGTIINSGTVQRFIKGNAAWRLVGIPFSLSTKIKGGTNLSNTQFLYLNNIFSPTHIYHFNDTLDNGKYGVGAGVNAGWVSMASDVDSIQPNRGLLIYGSRAIGNQTVSYTGFFNNGDVSIPLSKIANGKGWNLIANPYVSNINFTTITQNVANDGVLLGNTVYGVNPLGGGGYAFTSYVAGTGTGVNGGSNIIENGAAFFVRAADVNKTLVIRQSDKTNAAVGTTTGGVTLLGANDNYNSIRVSLNGANKQSDEVVFVWGRFNKATEGFDEDLDAYDLGASGTHDLAIVDNAGTRYSIFNGANLQKNTDTRTYKLATKNLQLGTYSFAVAMPKALDKSNEAYIVDNYLGTAVLVKEALVHSFNVTDDAASKAEGRFQLEVRKK
jgi:hypothetical protein